MIIPTILHRIYPTHEKIINHNIDRFQTFISSIASLACVYGVCHYNYYEDYNTLWSCCLYILYYVSIDLLFCKLDYFVHHFIAIGCFIGFWVGGGGADLALTSSTAYTSWVSIVMKSAMATEISTLFLNLRHILILEYPDRFSNFKNVIEVGFIGTFVYNRLYVFPRNIVFDFELYEKFTTGYVIAFGLFLLNIYWFAHIVKKVFRRRGIPSPGGFHPPYPPVPRGGERSEPMGGFYPPNPLFHVGERSEPMGGFYPPIPLFHVGRAKRAH